MPPMPFPDSPFSDSPVPGPPADRAAAGAAERELRAAVAHVAEVFAGMAAHPDEKGCSYCWPEEEIALLLDPDAALPDELVGAVAREVGSHWDDHPAVVRRILPRLVVLMASGEANTVGMEAAQLARAGIPSWPREEAGAVRRFLDAWWTATLRHPDPPTPASDVFETCAMVSGTFTPWLDRWARERGPAADAHLGLAVDDWMDNLSSDSGVCSGFHVPWADGEEPVDELRSWTVAHAPDRLRARGADPVTVHRVELLALPEEERWEERHWPPHLWQALLGARNS